MENAIFNKGKKGDVVVLDGIVLDKIEDNPLYGYDQPAFFTITGTKWDSDTSREDKDMLYVLRDMSGKEFSVNGSGYCGCGWWLVKLDDWAKSKIGKYEEILEYEREQKEKLKHQIEILKDILTNQGIRIVKENQAKELGL